MDDSSFNLTRRRALGLVGSTVTLAQLGLLSKSVASIAGDAPPNFLSDEQFSMVERIIDLIIPETDTPGALRAGVHRFIDLMLVEWASPARQAQFVAGLEDIDGRAREFGVDGFVAASADQQTHLLRAMDKERIANDGTNSFFGELRKLVLFAYYTSEVGATVELQHQPVPVDYLPCVPVDEIGRAWFWLGYGYEL